MNITPMRRMRSGRWIRRLTVAWRRSSLARQTFIAFYSFTVIMTAAIFFLSVEDTRERVLEMQRSTMASVFPILEGAIAESMIHKSPGSIAQIFAAHQVKGGVDRLILLDSEKRAVNTDDLALKGSRPRRFAPPPIDAKHDIVIDFPIPNRPACVGCHGALQPQLGYLRAISPRRDGDIVAQANVKSRLMVLCAGIISMALWTLIITRRVIDEPMRRIIAAMRSVAAGRLETRVDRLPSGELRAIAHGFNRMVRLLSKDRAENAELHRRQVAHMERLAALGELSAHLAHEVRNPLTGISSAMQVMQAEEPVGGARRELLEKILSQLRRMEQTMGNFLRFARMPDAVVCPFDLSGPIDRALDLLRPRLKSQGIEVRREIPGSLPQLKGDPGQIEQVFLNLLINSAHAMPRGGILTVTVRVESDRSVLAEVSDTGAGIPSADLENVFKPFFTTRDGGSGLGLPLARQIVMAHDGDIWIESVPERGTSVFVRLPPPGAEV